MKEYNLSSNVLFGAGSIDYLSRYDGKNVAIVTEKALKDMGMIDTVLSLLSCSNIGVFCDILPDPTISQVTNCYKFIKKRNAEIVIAIGGGSVIDTVKAAVLIEKVDTGKKIFFVAVPTTSGTGSEVTCYTVLKDDESGQKFPITDPIMKPDIAILDYTLTKSLPQSVTANTGMDVITHALEAYVAKNANPMTDAFAEKALSLAFGNLYKAYTDGNDDVARENMMMASYLAGLAFDGAGLGLCHSIAHNFGARFKIPHGLANALALPSVVAYNSGLDVPFGTDKSEVAKRYAKISALIGLPQAGVRLSVQNLVREIQNLSKKMKIPQNLVQAGVSRENFKESRGILIEGILQDSCLALNPTKADAGDIGKLLDRINSGMFI